MERKKSTSFRKTTIRKDIGKEHVIDIADMSQVTIPVEGIGVTTLYLCIHGVARQTVLPEDRGLQRLKVRLIPHIRAQFAPTWTPWMEVGLIDGKSLGVGLGDKLRLTGNRPHMFRVDRFTQGSPRRI